VEQAGMKGCRLGSASVSAKHANFIQADPGGSADDVYRLVREVQARVAERFGVALRTEIRLVGFEPSSSTGGL
jgi:UDP-N-acetylmuramate dehydrogenase